MSIQSMTGFGSGERDGFRVDVRSLNHRYLDISVKMPPALLENEILIRNMIKERFARGKFEVFISFTDKRQYNFMVNKEMARGIYNAFLEIQRELSIPGIVGIDLLSRYGDMLISDNPEYSVDSLKEALMDAISQLEDMRKKEGEILANFIKISLKRIIDINEKIKDLSKDTTLRCREALTKKISDLISDLSIDESRLAQEVAFIAQKTDITEELVRLNSHASQFLNILSNGNVIGRRLDFFLQEMNREANTIASKSDDSRIIDLTIELKTEIEKIREQIQNIQ